MSVECALQCDVLARNLAGGGIYKGPIVRLDTSLVAKATWLTKSCQTAGS